MKIRTELTAGTWTASIDQKYEKSYVFQSKSNNISHYDSKIRAMLRKNGFYIWIFCCRKYVVELLFLRKEPFFKNRI
jgi:hypothetical protein